MVFVTSPDGLVASPVPEPQLLDDSGYRIESIRGVPAPFPKVLGNGVLGQTAVRANLALIRLSQTLFSYQIFVLAKSTPDVDFVLQDAKEKSAKSGHSSQRF